MALDCQTLVNKKGRHEEEDQTASHMENLPREIVLDIIFRLPISSLTQFKYVCRSWRLLAQDSQVLNLHSSTRDGDDDNFLCLIFNCDYPIRNQLYFSDYPAFKEENQPVKRIFTPFSAAMPKYNVVGSSNGFLCLSDSLYNDKLFIYNPFTRDYLELPKTKDFQNQYVVCGVGFHPETKLFKVVKIIYYGVFQCVRRYHRSEVQVLTLGSSTWKCIGEVCHHLVQGQSQALVNGRLHWVSLPRRYHLVRNLVSFDLADEQFREVPKPDPGSLSTCDYHLVVLSGCLSAAVYCHDGKMEIWVMKEYGVKESWVKSFNIGDYMPKALKQEAEESFRVTNIVLRGRFVQVLCILKNGEILLEYKNRALVLFDPITGIFKDVHFPGMPKQFQTVVHIGSLNRIDALIGSQIELFYSTQYNEKKGWINDNAREKYEQMIQLKDQILEERSQPLTDFEICESVLGKRSGHVEGFGRAPKPTRMKWSSFIVERDPEIRRLQFLIEAQQAQMQTMREEFEARQAEFKSMQGKMRRFEEFMLQMQGSRPPDGSSSSRN